MTRKYNFTVLKLYNLRVNENCFRENIAYIISEAKCQVLVSNIVRLTVWQIIQLKLFKSS